MVEVSERLLLDEVGSRRMIDTFVRAILSNGSVDKPQVGFSVIIGPFAPVIQLTAGESVVRDCHRYRN